MSGVAKWRGLTALVRDVVTNGSAAIEKVQKETAKRPFTVLEAIPAIAPAARVVHLAHDLSVTATHGAIRVVTHAADGALSVLFDSLDGDAGPPPSSKD
jgi:hypothetical protein